LNNSLLGICLKYARMSWLYLSSRFEQQLVEISLKFARTSNLLGDLTFLWDLNNSFLRSVLNLQERHTWRSYLSLRFEQQLVEISLKSARTFNFMISPSCEIWTTACWGSVLNMQECHDLTFLEIWTTACWGSVLNMQECHDLTLLWDLNNSLLGICLKYAKMSCH
jgi:hypothetical protein